MADGQVRRVYVCSRFLRNYLTFLRQLNLTHLIIRIQANLCYTSPLQTRPSRKIRWIIRAISADSISDQFTCRPTGSTVCALTYFLHHVTANLAEMLYDTLFKLPTVKVKVKEVNLYSAFIVVPHTRGAQVRITQCYLQITPYLPLSRKHSPNGASPDWGCGHLIAAYYSLSTPKGWKAESVWLVGWPTADGLPT